MYPQERKNRCRDWREIVIYAKIKIASNCSAGKRDINSIYNLPVSICFRDYI